MAIQTDSLAVSGVDSVVLAAGALSGRWLPWVALLVPLVIALVVYLTGRGDRNQDRAAEAVRDFQRLVEEIEFEQHRLRGQAASAVELKPLRDLQLKAELAPARLPQALQLCARELESRLAKYLAVAGPAPVECSAEERDARVEQRTHVGQDLQGAINSADKAIAAHKARRKG